MDPLVLSWEGAALAGPGLAGGKGWNLGRLRRYGFKVPAGGVLTAALYRTLLGSPALRPLLRRVEHVSATEADSPEAAASLEAVRQAIEGADLPQEAMAALGEALDTWGLAGRPLAVCSSATAEDSPTASFAGIHRSFLNVTDLEAVAAAVKGCYASLWTPQALAYRHRLGLADAEVGCAVVICEMVGGESGPTSAGVAFSCDPRTGRRDLVTIAAARGLGEALVGGRVSPEEIAIQYECLSFRVAEWGGAGRRVLSEAQALELARLAVRVQWALGEGQDPQDIEWAHDGRRFWLPRRGRPPACPTRPFPRSRTCPSSGRTPTSRKSFPG